MEVPDFVAHFKISKWETQDIQPKFDLPQLWVHVEGVPHTVRHFHGLWAMGSLLGTAVDVDLPTLYNQNGVRVLVAMMNPDNLNKHKHEKGYYVDATVILKLKGYDFRFRKQAAGFQPDTMYSPFFWRSDGLEDNNSYDAKGKGAMPDQNVTSSSNVTNLVVDGAAAGQGGGPSLVQQRNGAADQLASSASRPVEGASRGRPNVMGRTLPPRVQLLDVALHGPPVVRLGMARPLAREPLVQDFVAPVTMQLPIIAGPLVETLEVAGPTFVEDLGCGASVLPKSAAPIAQAGAEVLAHAHKDASHVSSLAALSSSVSVGAGVGGVSSPAMTPPTTSTPDSSSPAVLPGLHPSQPPSSPIASAVSVYFVSPPRWSVRYGEAADGSSVTDKDSMHRAMRRKAQINLDYSGTISPSKAKSYLSFSTPVIESKLCSVGIKLGNSEKDISISSGVLRRMEVDRLMVTPKVLTFSNTTYIVDEEEFDTTDGQLLSQLIGDVSDVIMDESRLSSLYELKASGRKIGSCSSKKGEKPKKRAKVSASAIVSR
jgi:hypothetical protein